MLKRFLTLFVIVVVSVALDIKKVHPLLLETAALIIKTIFLFCKKWTNESHTLKEPKIVSGLEILFQRKMAQHYRKVPNINWAPSLKTVSDSFAHPDLEASHWRYCMAFSRGIIWRFSSCPNLQRYQMSKTTLPSLHCLSNYNTCCNTTD